MFEAIQNEVTLYQSLDSEETLERAWFNAVENLTTTPNYRIMNLVLNVKNPINPHECNGELVEYMNKFNEKHNKVGVSDISCSYFPDDYGYKIEIHKLSNTFLASIDTNNGQYRNFPKWGSYFERMVRRIGNDSEINQIEIIIKNLINEDKDRFYKDIFEIIIFDPNIDNVNKNSHPNMSMIELKPILHRSGTKILDMTAVYGSQDYMFNAFGDLLGLNNLHKYLSIQSGFSQGALTVFSLFAYFEKQKSSVCKKLIKNCREIIEFYE